MIFMCMKIQEEKYHPLKDRELCILLEMPEYHWNYNKHFPPSRMRGKTHIVSVSWSLRTKRLNKQRQLSLCARNPNAAKFIMGGPYILIRISSMAPVCETILTKISGGFVYLWDQSVWITKNSCPQSKYHWFFIRGLYAGYFRYEFQA